MEVLELKLVIYLAGQIHDNWREELEKKAQSKKIQLKFVAPQTNHDRSDDIGEAILGEQPSKFYKDDETSGINKSRHKVMMEKSDVVVAMFGEHYKQWNTVMDASAAITMNTPLLIIRPESLIHPLKELSNKANVTVETIDQALDVLSYIFE